MEHRTGRDGTTGLREVSAHLSRGLEADRPLGGHAGRPLLALKGQRALREGEENEIRTQQSDVSDRLSGLRGKSVTAVSVGLSVLVAQVHLPL